MHNSKEEIAQYRSRSELTMYDHIAVDGDMFLQVWYTRIYYTCILISLERIIGCYC